MPSAAELLAADPHVLRESGFSARKGETLRALAEGFVDGRLSDEALSRMTDDEVEATLTEVSGIGPWTARGFLLVALDRPDVFLSGDLALRRVIFISGDDADAKADAVALFQDAGFAAIDLGDLATGGAMQQIHHPLAGVNLIRV